jgi:hypothetical protein
VTNLSQIRPGNQANGFVLETPAHNANVEFADFLSQRVPIETEQLCGFDLISPRRTERRTDQRQLNLAQNPLV